ncbi:alanine racemase [Actinocrinis puniceicyclus]|uniref:Alanine racemase n=1 Tax=Actinocrinis puniceicyclus TaxID=977794 RepID=A0A8J7WRC1_9ACTN|nr:alanine racemase [Actinocrinis puniceicyclus]MBS2964140.1 alanine racemase [Actinocrinis puniceicyclus]
MSTGEQARLEARIDLAAVRSNVRRMREVAGSAQVMAVVKADAYGHGMVQCARAAVEAGATWLGTALPEEALALRAAGLTVPILTWLHVPGDPFADLIAAGVDVSVSGLWALREVTEAVRALGGRPARIQLKADTGLGRNGAPPHDWPLLVEEAVKAQEDGLVTVTGLWSHFACADEPRHPSVAAQLSAFHVALDIAERAGLRPEVRHIANSPATLLVLDSHFDLVRSGLATYGVSPAPDEGSAADFGLHPAMTLVGRLALVKQVEAGSGISYGHTYHTARRTRLGLVPAGYADGIPRAASNRAPVWIDGVRHTIAGRVAMDQFVVDLGDQEAGVGDEVVLFGPGERGEPTAQDWAELVGTIAYEIVTRIGPRVARVYLHAGGNP